MRKAKGIAGATLLYGPHDPPPDLVSAMQFVVDDLRAEGRRISGLRLSTRQLRLRADEFEIALTLANGPMPADAFDTLTRPNLPALGQPDIARPHLVHSLRSHTHALGFILRHRGALPPDLDALSHRLARQGQVLLLPVFEAAPPTLLIWQPGGVLFTLPEFLGANPQHLLAEPNPTLQLALRLTHRRQAQRPGSTTLPAVPPAPANRVQRAALRSGGRLFGTPPAARPPIAPRIEIQSDRITAALRHADPPPPPPRRRAAARLTVATLWCFLLPQVFGGWLPRVLGDWLPL